MPWCGLKTIRTLLVNCEGDLGAPGQGGLCADFVGESLCWV